MEVIITGTGSGIGQALALYYLSEGNKVIGISRKNTIDHPNFVFVQADLLTTDHFDDLLASVSFDSELMLINNAGIVGVMERISEQKESDISEVMTLNAIRPMQLCQTVLQRMPLAVPLTIVNISSGAGRRSVAGWAAYCSSKAAIDLYAQTIALEEVERGRNLKVYSVAPGVVDTPMQEKIRAADEKTFSDVQTFVDLYQKGELTSLSEMVSKFNRLMSAPYDGKILYSLRDF